MPPSIWYRYGHNTKTIFVEIWNLTNPPVNTPVYDSFISRKSVHTLFLVADLYGFGFLAADISNVFLDQNCDEKLWFLAGPGFNICEGVWILILRTMNVFKSIRSRFCANISYTIADMVFKPFYDDCEFWIKSSYLTLYIPDEGHSMSTSDSETGVP